VKFTASVAPVSGISETGTVQFVIDGANAGSPVTLNANSASYTTSSLAAGTHTVVAIYSGDANFQSSQSNSFSQTVLPGWLTATAGANIVWTPAASPQTLQINSGTATIIADPGEAQFNNGAGDSPVITVTGASLVIAPTMGACWCISAACRCRAAEPPMSLPWAPPALTAITGCW